LPRAAARPRPVRYAPLFPDWTGPQPVEMFMLEELLEARRESAFPTNARGPDEDVNIYVAHLLAAHLFRPAHPDVKSGAEPLRFPPDLPRRERAEWYRRNGDHRLIGLGLYGRGELRRRRAVPFGASAEEARERDVADGQACYALAASLWRDGHAGAEGIGPVLRKLSLAFADYVGVLDCLARGRFGLGARLSAAALRELAPWLNGKA